MQYTIYKFVCMRATLVCIPLTILCSSLDKDDSLEAFPQPSTAPVLENPDYQTKWYHKYFLGKFHTNYVGGGGDGGGNAYALSVLQERSFGKTVLRAVLWTKDGPKRLCMREGAKTSPKQILAHFGHADKMERQSKEVRTGIRQQPSISYVLPLSKATCLLS